MTQPSAPVPESEVPAGAPSEGQRGSRVARQIPNLLCVGRVVAVFAALAYLAETHQSEGRWSAPAVVVIAIAALTDQLDGFLAKRYGWASALGAVLDQISDKLVTLALFCFLAVSGAFPAWALGLIVFRELFVTCLRISANLERIQIKTSQGGRFKTFTQQVAVFLIFLHWAYPQSVLDALPGLTVSQCLLWGGWLVFWAVMLGMGRRGFAGLRRTYTTVRVDPRTHEESRSSADLTLVYLTILAMAVPLHVGGPLVVLTITVGTGVTYFGAYRWARDAYERRTRAGARNVALSLLGAAALSGGLAGALVAWPTLPVMWALVGVLSVLWTALLTVSYRTNPAAT